MPLSNESKFSMQAMTEAVNELPSPKTQIRELGLFVPKRLTTTYVRIEHQNGVLTLVQSKPRGSSGTASQPRARQKRSFEVPHLPREDFIRPDEVQNVSEFGNPNKAQAVDTVVLERLEDMKSDIVYTREHMMLGALLGDIKDGDTGEIFYNIYDEFKLKRQVFNWKLTTASTQVGALMDDTKRKLRKHAHGEIVNGFIALCSPEFFDKLKYHNNVKEFVKEKDNAKEYREDSGGEFIHNGVRFIEYDGDFGGGKASHIEAGSAILLPSGTRKTFHEYFAPADTNSAVNTLAELIYAQREKLPLDKGWHLEVQSNPLPLVLRPNLVATLKME
ncbi:major capsid protein [Wielerella bovis]|uniref:major capsid protein n=1 Tax=Wielerella bovis TaxID=2917790 RepID=UPI0020199BC6|nr:major capsid protein [Wielerella bovis]ULJ69281.1 major capsid protein [Wielerella bovis]